MPKTSPNLGTESRPHRRRTPKFGTDGAPDGLDSILQYLRGCQVSTLVVNVGEASRGLRIHVKESEPTTNANDNVALAA